MHNRQVQPWWMQQFIADSRPELRIGDAERTAVTEFLQDHYAEGRLDSEELEERLDATLAAKTRSELSEIVKDLPGARPWEAAARPQAPGWQHRPHRHHRRGFLKAPFLLLFLVIAPIAAVTDAPWLFFGTIRLLLVVWLGAMLFGYLRRRRHRAVAS